MSEERSEEVNPELILLEFRSQNKYLIKCVQKLEDENLELAAAYNNARKEIRVLKINAKEIIRHSEKKDKIISNLERENKRYRKALEDIAVDRIYESELMEVIKDVARQALEG